METKSLPSIQLQGLCTKYKGCVSTTRFVYQLQGLCTLNFVIVRESRLDFSYFILAKVSLYSITISMKYLRMTKADKQATYFIHNEKDKLNRDQSVNSGNYISPQLLAKT